MFIFNGKSSNELNLYCEDEQFLGISPSIYEEMSIDGKDGSDLNFINYQNYEKNITLYLRDPSKIDEVKCFLRGKGTFIYNNRKTLAYFLDEIDIDSLFDKAFKIKTKFVRHPFWYKIDEEYTKVNKEIINEGNIYCRPFIKLVGTGNIDLSINNVRFTYHFDEDNEVEIDCNEMTEKYNGISKSRNIDIGFKYPILYPGKNELLIHSGNAEIYVKRKDAWL